MEGTVAAIKRRKGRRERVALEAVQKAQGSVPQGHGPSATTPTQSGRKGLAAFAPWQYAWSLGQDHLPGAGEVSISSLFMCFIPRAG